LGKTYQEIGSLARMELNTRNSSKFLSSHPTLVSQIYCKSPTCFSNLTWASCTSLQMFVSFLFHLLSNLSSRDSHRKDFWWRKAHASALSAWPELIGATWVILFFLYSGCAEKCCVTSGLNKATCSPSMPCVAEQSHCSLHVKELKVTTTWRTSWKLKYKTTEQLLDCAVTGRLRYSYWKAENTVISIKEIRKQWSMKNVNNKPRFTMKEKLNIL